MTVISKSTIEVLKNFCSINKSIVIKPGNKVATLSINKNILAIADVQEQFDSQISIYDLGVFLGGLSLFDQPKIDTSESNYVTVSDERGRSKTRFFYADPDVIVQPPEKEIDLPSTAVKFFLPHHHCNSCSVLLVSINCLTCVFTLIMVLWFCPLPTVRMKLLTVTLSKLVRAKMSFAIVSKSKT